MIILASILLAVVCVAVHGATLFTALQFLLRRRHFRFYRIAVLIVVAIVAHLIEILLFQSTYGWLLSYPEYGSLAGVTEPTASELFYFSAITYTSTGYGDITPVGNIRLLAIVEALTGLIMIAWTASFAFLVLQRYWVGQVAPQAGRSSASESGRHM